MYTATEWSTVKDKERFVKQFKAFVLSDFARTKFPKWFYNRLLNCFGMIAHYDIYGFYATFFEDTAGKVDFAQQCLEYPCYGDPARTFSDVERDLQVWLAEQTILPKLQGQKAANREAVERAELARLQAKYGK